MRKLIFIIVAFISLLTGCENNKIDIYHSGHIDNPSRELIPEPDLSLRLQSMYAKFSEEKLNGKIKKENYLADKKFGDATSETDIVLGRNENNQVVFLEEYILDRYADKTYEIIQTYFFDKYGRVFAIEQHTNSICKEDDAHQTIVRFYNPNFRLINSNYEIKGTSGVDLDKNVCGSAFDETLGLTPNYCSLLESYKQIKEKI